MSAEDIIDQLLAQLGPAVLLPNHYGTKNPIPRAWGRKTLENMKSKHYRAMFKGCNIGVNLGDPSLGLCSIDIDDDLDIPAFFEANPALKETLQSRGGRGCNVWVRMLGDYPKQTIFLKTLDGKKWGEWRSTGGQTIIHGWHPSGVEYRRNHYKPLAIPFDCIVWPPGIADPPSVQKTKKITELPDEPDDSEESEVGGVDAPNGALLSRVLSIEDAVRLSTPTQIHTNNDCLFTLARAVLSLETLAKRKFTPAQLEDVFQKWYEKALPFLRPGQSREEYMIQFFHSYRYAKYPLGSYIIPKAFELAKSQPTPPEAERFTNPDFKLLVGLCKQLQIMAEQDPFYLSSRVCAQLFNHPNHTTAAKWLSTLVVLQILEIVEEGTTSRATRYRYKGKL